MCVAAIHAAYIEFAELLSILLLLIQVLTPLWLSVECVVSVFIVRVIGKSKSNTEYRSFIMHSIIYTCMRGLLR